MSFPRGKVLIHCDAFSLVSSWPCQLQWIADFLNHFKTERKLVPKNREFEISRVHFGQIFAKGQSKKIALDNREVRKSRVQKIGIPLSS